MQEASPKTIAEAILALEAIRKVHGSLPISVCVDGRNHWAVSFKVETVKGHFGESTMRLRIGPTGEHL